MYPSSVCVLKGHVCPSSVCVLRECTGMQPLGRHFVTCLKGDSTLGPALVLLDVVVEKLTRVQWEPCAHRKAHSWTVNDSETLETATVCQQENGCKIPGRFFSFVEVQLTRYTV